jgi:hypothetical protein
MEGHAFVRCMPTICVIVDEVEPISVVNSPKMRLCDGQPNSIRDTLTERSCGDLDT